MIRCCVFAGALIIVAGCSKSSDKLPQLHAVKGKLTMGGATVGKGYVRFDPETPQELTVSAQVDESGRFELETVATRGGKPSKGAPSGTYKVFYVPENVGNQTETTAVETARTYTIEGPTSDLNIDLTAK